MIFSIFERIPNQEDKKSFSIVCKRFLKVACFQLRSLNNQLPDLLYDILIASPKMVLFECHKTLTNNHMKLIAESCPNIKDLILSSRQYNDQDQEVDKLEFDDVGLCAIADACIHLVRVYLFGRLRFKEIGIGSLVRSCKNLKVLNLRSCSNVTDKSLKVIGEAACIERLNLGGCYLISDNGMLHLKKLASLNSLDLSKCYNISWEDVWSIALTCPKLMSLRLSRRIRKPIPKAGPEKFYNGNYNHFIQLEWK